MPEVGYIQPNVDLFNNGCQMVVEAHLEVKMLGGIQDPLMDDIGERGFDPG